MLLTQALRATALRRRLHVALGGDCPADAAVLRSQSGLFGPVASHPVVSRLMALAYSVGFIITEEIAGAIPKWSPAWRR